MLGSLLAKVELEITAATRLDEGEEADDVAHTLTGWMEQAGPTALEVNVLLNRLQRTALHLIGPGRRGDPPVGRSAAAAAVVTAAGMLSAHLAFEGGETDKTRRALGSTESPIIAILEGMHALRVAIGDAEE
ncbi:hypothetical protein HEK131_45000 [Streptomyces seoulensis]|nr:hypothetical protein HEK131_45000 [Streptomyces seoulensis]